MKTRRVKIVNLLATDLTLISGPGDSYTKTYYNPGPTAKVASKMTAIAQIHPWENGSGALSVPLLSVSETRVIGLPEPEEDTLYVVSGAVAGFLEGSREDVVTPSRIVEDNDGWIVGCKALLQIRDERGTIDEVTKTWCRSKIREIIREEFDTFNPTPAIEKMADRIVNEILTRHEPSKP